MRWAAALILAGWLGGCAQQAGPVVEAMPMEAPSTSMVATAARPIRAGQVLSGDEADYFTGRLEKGADGPLALWALSSYSIYTYDAERISSRFDGGGYRYRMLWQQGVISPVGP